VWAPCEHPAIAMAVPATKAATTTAPHPRDRSPHQRMVSMYATLAAVMERFGYCECCRP